MSKMSSWLKDYEARMKKERVDKHRVFTLIKLIRKRKLELKTMQNELLSLLDKDRKPMIFQSHEIDRIFRENDIYNLVK